MAITPIIPNKKYQVRVYYRDDLGRPRDVSRIVNGTEKDARKVESQLDEELKNGFSSFMKFIDLTESYYSSRNTLSEDSLRKEKEIHKTYLSILNNKKAASITAREIQTLRNHIETIDGSITQKNKAIFLIKRIFKHGNLFYNLTDPTIYLKGFKKKVSETFEYHTYTPEEFNYILKFVNGENYKLLYEIYFWAGLRRGEALALTPRDLLPTEEIRVSKSINSRKELGNPKNESSFRNVKIHTELYQRLLPYAKSKNQNLLGGMRYLPPSTVNGRFTRAIIRANKQRNKDGLEELPHLRIHDLRHSHATFLAAHGVPIAAVSARLGHSSINETMNTYMHLFRGDDQRIVEMINNYVK